MLLAVVGSSSISSTRIADSPGSPAKTLSALNGLEARINHSRSEGKRLIFPNALVSLDSLQRSYKVIHSIAAARGIVRWIARMAASHERILSDRILFIDAEAIVLDKPAGLPVDAPRRGGDSIASRLDELQSGFKRPPTPMHRLDRIQRLSAVRPQSPRRARSSSRPSRRGRSRNIISRWWPARSPRSEGVIDVPLARFRALTPAGGWSPTTMVKRQ